MAYFYVTIETIKTIDPIEGADRIQRATLEGLPFQFVIGKDIYKVGEKVLYFPIDALIPSDVAQKMGVYGKLAGVGKDRVKTIKLKSVLSQGIIGKINLIESLLVNATPEAITEFLGVTKYEPPSIMEKGANLKSLPGNLTIYDIEGTDRFQHIVDYMMSKLVRIDEKIEGQNVHFDYIQEKFYVSQRRHTIEPIGGDEHTWWKYARENNIEEKIKLIYKKFNKDIALYCEGCGPGIQGNYYNFPNHKCLFYDIKIGDTFLDTEEALSIFEEFKLPLVPILSVNVLLKDFLNGKNIIEVSDGKSKIIDKNREGIVIRLMKEEKLHNFGRSIINKRGPIYLSKTDN